MLIAISPALKESASGVSPGENECFKMNRVGVSAILLKYFIYYVDKICPSIGWKAFCCLTCVLPNRNCANPHPYILPDLRANSAAVSPSSSVLQRAKLELP